MSGRTIIPKPHLDARLIGARRIPALVDDGLAHAIGVRIAFTGRGGGWSRPPYDELNLGTHVGDDPVAVERNRAEVLGALGAPDAALVALNQVHGTDGVAVESTDAASLEAVREKALLGADFAVVEAPGVAALLCFADCASLIIVSPTGRFAVAHAGWRGAVAHIVRKAACELAARDEADAGQADVGSYNAYIGPHIRSECFECGDEVVQAFRREFGERAIADPRHVDLSAALFADLERAGLDPERIIDAGVCTMCHPDEYFSYRASGGTCGRHGAIAVRLI